MKTILQNLLLAIGIVAFVLLISICLASIVQSNERDNIRNQRFDECQTIAEQNQLGQEFIKNCMN